jgi:outer membrane protein OmpA-like peptidoglycan-associated protein
MSSTSKEDSQAVVLVLMVVLVSAVIALVLGLAMSRAASSAPATAFAAASSAATPSRADVAPTPPPLTTEFLPKPPEVNPANVRVDYGVVRFFFAPASAELAPGAAGVLQGVLAGARSGRVVLISGFHDPSGDAASNIALAKRRAQAVHDALLAAGVKPAQIRLAPVMPAAPPSSPSFADARRVDIELQ